MQENIAYTLIRSKRKSISIEIKPDTTVIVRAPLHLSERKISQFVTEKSGWIKKHTEAVKKAREELPEMSSLSENELSQLTAQAKAVIPKRCAYYAKILGVEYGRITVRHQKTKWGSCSSKKDLNFNCLLMLTPPEALDAVVVHELCHLKYMNHSKSFYNEVLSAYPEYPKWNAWLKENGNIILERIKK